MQRRSVIAGAAVAIAASGAPGWLRRARAQAAPTAARVPTPAQSEGPFYPVELPPEVDADLMTVDGRAYGKGEPLLLSGRVEDLAGRPVEGARVEIWQCDADGRYHHPGDGGRADRGFQGFARVVTDAQGRYRFRAMRPVAYPGRTPHIHVKVGRGARTLLTTQMYVAGEASNERDGLLGSVRDPARREALLARLAREPGGGWAASFPIVLDLRA